MIDYNASRTLLRASPYRDFTGVVRTGKIHLLKDHPDEAGRQRTHCGKTIELCPGEIAPGFFGDVDCKVCRNSVISADQWAENSARWAAEREARRLEDNQRWWAAYDQYLQSPTWAEKRRMVLRRCGAICEGCGTARAIQVHHRSYPQGVWPGSAEWIRTEKLFTLVALCDDCHDDMHQ